MELLKKKKCSGCLSCYNSCPKQAIILEKDCNGFLYPKIKTDKCINCGLCINSCPSLNKKVNRTTLKEAYACFNRNEEKRKTSSSGGVFSAFAEYIISIGGVVYGAQFDENWSVIHRRVDNIIDLQNLKTSKYVQSFIDNTYKLAENDLKNGMTVLFTGTPCEIEGLYGFLGENNYENLITQDLICHGVPSEKIWQKYIAFRKSEDLKENILSINFRNKNNGWQNYGINFNYSDNLYFSPHYNDEYFKPFLHNYGLRDSCYNCDFKSTERVSDITLADFWGIHKVLPNFDRFSGVSLMIVNSSKGKELFNTVKKELVYEQTDFYNSISGNSAMTVSVQKPIVRKFFFKNLDKLQFNVLVEKCEKKNGSFIYRLIGKAVHILKTGI